MSYGTQYYAELNLGLMKIVYSRDRTSAVYVKDGDTWKTHVMTTKGNYVWKLIYTSEKQYQVYRNSELVASGKVEKLPANTKFPIISKVNNEKVSIDYITITDSTILNAPANLTATTNDGKIELRWEAVDSATSYSVARSVYSAGPYETIISGITANSFIDSSAQPGVTYYYVVKASNELLESAYSNEVSATIEIKEKAFLNVVNQKNLVKVGEIFTSAISLESVSKVYAEDFTISYDTNLLEFVGFDEIKGYKVYNTPTDKNGQIRFIVASQGEEYGVSAAATLLNLKFKAKAAGSGNVDALYCRVANIENEWDLNDGSCGGDTVTVVEESIRDVNHSGEYTLVDLAIDGFYYGHPVADTDTTNHSADQVIDGIINDDDLVYIVNQILINPNYPPNRI